MSIKMIGCGMLAAFFGGLASLAAPVPPPAVAGKPGEEQQFEIASGVKMIFCWIPAGTATLGSPPNEEKREADDEKEHEYTSSGFWLGKYAVTQQEWIAVMGPGEQWINFRGVEKMKELDTARFPAECISWDDCQEFLKKINERSGATKAFGKVGKFTLPHGDEWEYACRGGLGNKTPFYWGNALNGDKANCDGSCPYGTKVEGANKERPTPVGSYAKEAPHPWGLCDMHGNVWQWCENWYGREKKFRVLRGGSWFDLGVNCRAASVDRIEPQSSSYDRGFRVCYRLD